jgi:pimeloyl-ACP methyl ester carboxylesterase
MTGFRGSEGAVGRDEFMAAVSRSPIEQSASHGSGEFVTVAGIKTHYRHAGIGPTLVMLHGQLPGSCVDVEWADNVERVAEAGFSVWAPDLVGFGKTDNPADYSIEARIAHARAFIERVEPTRYALWGCSMGSYIGCRIALDDPRVDKLILMPSSVLPPPLPGAVPQSAGSPLSSVGAAVQSYTPSLQNARNLLKLVVMNPPRLTEALVQRFYENSAGKNAEAEHGRRSAPRPKPLYEELKRLTARCFLLWGADDPASIAERALLLQRAMRDAELHVLPNCGHWPQVDQPERCIDLVGAFLRS